MFLTVHAAAGAAIGSLVPGAPLTLGLGVLSHFVFDRIPHYDPPIVPGTAQEGVLRNPIFRRFAAIAFADLLVATLLTAGFIRAVSPAHPLTIAVGAFGGILPDLVFGLYRLTGNSWLKKFNRIHEANHFDPKKIPVTFITGMATQVMTFAIALHLLFWLSNPLR